MKKSKKITLIIISSILVAILLAVGVFIVVDKLKHDYNFQRLNVSVDNCYINNIEYVEGANTLNATINVRMMFVNYTNKEIGIDTNIISLYLDVLDQNSIDLKNNEIVALNGEGVITTYLGNYLEENQYLTINGNDIKIVNVAIPVSIQFEINLTESELSTKLNNWKVCWASTYFSGSFDNIKMVECDIRDTINII